MISNEKNNNQKKDKGKKDSGFMNKLCSVFFIFFIFWFIRKQVKGQGMQAFTFGQSRAKISDPVDAGRVTFKDVVGVREVKEELEEIVDFLRNPKKFIDIGAQIPKGVLLE